MSYRFAFGEPVAEGARRICNEQIDRALDEIDDDERSLHDRVHQVRKRCKKIRGLARLVRPALGSDYSAINAYFRDTARPLSALRDAHAMVEMLDDLQLVDTEDAREADRTAVREALVRRRDALCGEVDVLSLLRTVRMRLEEGRATPRTWPLDREGFDAVEKGLRRTAKRARKAMRNATDEGTPAAHHEWRKRVKYLWYHLRLLRRIWTAPMEGLEDEAHRCASLLGDDHDVAVFRSIADHEEDLAAAPGLQRIQQALARRSTLWRQDALDIGLRLHDEKPKRFTRRLRVWSEVANCPRHADH